MKLLACLLRHNVEVHDPGPIGALPHVPTFPWARKMQLLDLAAQDSWEVRDRRSWGSFLCAVLEYWGGRKMQLIDLSAQDS